MANTENDQFVAGEIIHRINVYRRERIAVLPKITRDINGFLRIMTLVRKEARAAAISWTRNSTHFIIKVQYE